MYIGIICYNIKLRILPTSYLPRAHTRHTAVLYHFVYYLNAVYDFTVSYNARQTVRVERHGIES